MKLTPTITMPVSADLREDKLAVGDDVALLAALKGRSADAWALVYDRHYPTLYRYALARTFESAVAEDLAATVFLEALKGIDRYTYRGRPLLAWLYRIASNTVSDYRKDRRRRLDLLTDLSGRAASFLSRGLRSGPAISRGGEADAGNPAATVELMDVREATNRLTEGQREVVILHYYVGLTLPEVARVVGKTERAVYSLQTRAIEALRRHMDV